MSDPQEQRSLKQSPAECDGETQHRYRGQRSVLRTGPQAEERGWLLQYVYEDLAHTFFEKGHYLPSKG